MNKYNARKVRLDGYTFDSAAEGRRYIELKALCNAHDPKERIWDLKIHPRYVLQVGPDAVEIGHYTADFEYCRNPGPTGATWRRVIEDVKSEPTYTTECRFRIKVFEALYTKKVTIVGLKPKRIIGKPKRAA